MRANFKFDACYRSQNIWDGDQTYLPWCYLLFFSKQFDDVWGWASRLYVSVLEFGPILAWSRFPVAEEFVVIFDIFCLMMCQMSSVKNLDRRPVNSAPGLFYYEAMLL